MNENKKTLWTRGFTMVFISNMLMQLGQQSMSTLLPKYVNSLGATSTVVGLVSGTFAVAALAIRPVASPAFDIVRKKLLIQIGIVIMMISFSIYHLAPSIELLIVGRALQGFGIGTSAPLLLSYACTFSDEDMIGKSVSMFSISTAFGQAIGPSVGLSLAASMGYKNVFLLGALCEAVSFVFLLFTPSDPKPAPQPYKIRLNRIIAPGAVPAAVLSALVTTSHACIGSFLAIYGGLLSIDNVGLFFTIYAFGLIVVRPILGGFVDKMGLRKGLIPCIGLYMATMVLISIMKTMAGVVAAAVFMAVSYGLITPAIQALAIKSVPPEQRGVGSNTLYIGTDVGNFLGPWLSGIVIDLLLSFGMESVSAYSAMFLIMLVPAVISIVIILRLTVKNK